MSSSQTNKRIFAKGATWSSRLNPKHRVKIIKTGPPHGFFVFSTEPLVYYRVIDADRRKVFTAFPTEFQNDYAYWKAP